MSSDLTPEAGEDGDEDLPPIPQIGTALSISFIQIPNDRDLNLNVYMQTSMETRLDAVEALASTFVNYLMP